MNHVSIIPLIGGFSIAATEALGVMPRAIFSYKPFIKHDSLYLNYLGDKKPPYYQIEDIDDSIISNYRNPEIVTGVPPCAGLSTAGVKTCDQRCNSKVNDWMYNAAEFALEKLQPNFYVFENAPGLYSNIGQPVRTRLFEIGRDNGYSILFYRTNSLLHGLPQRRIRTYVVYYKGEKTPKFENIRKPEISIGDYLSKLGTGYPNENDYIFEHPDITQYPMVKFFKHLYGDNWRDILTAKRRHVSGYKYLIKENLIDDFRDYVAALPEDKHQKKILINIDHIKNKISQEKGYRIGYMNIDINKDAINVIYSDSMGKMVHPNYDRLINIREFMYLMGMPNDFPIPNKGDFGKVGQNVPVNTSKDIITECIETLKGNRDFYYGNFVMYDNTLDKKGRPLF